MGRSSSYVIAGPLQSLWINFSYWAPAEFMDKLEVVHKAFEITHKILWFVYFSRGLIHSFHQIFKGV